MGKINIFGKNYNYVPYQNPMYLEKLKIRLINDKTFIRVFQNDITDKFYDTLKEIVDPNILHEMNSVLSVSGESGSGKSSMIISLLKQIIPNRFTYKNICFFDSQVLRLAKEIPRDSFIVRDEGVDKAIFGVGSQRTSRQLQILTETCRKAGLSLIFIEPEFRENEMSKFYLEVVDMDIENQITRVAVKDNYTKQYIGAIYVSFIGKDHPDIIEYEKVKDKFIEDMKAGKLTEAKEDYRKMAGEVVENINIEIFSKKKDRMAFIRSEYPNLTNAEIDMIATFVEVIIKHGEDALYKKSERD